MKNTAAAAVSALAATTMIVSGWLALTALVIDRAARSLHTCPEIPGQPAEDNS